jgi:hypothetical protein
MRTYADRMTTPTSPSFLRRHPILAAFGALAGLSLFAAYWPASAVITGVVVVGRATGADMVAWRWLRSTSARMAGRVQQAWRRHEAKHGAPEPAAPSPTPAPSAPQPGHGPGLDRGRAAHLRTPTRRVVRSRRSVGREPVAAELVEGELGG